MRTIELLEPRRLLSVAMLQDVNAGSAGSSPNWHIQLNGLSFFTAISGLSGTEQFVTDGTAAGTRMVLDIHPTDSSSPAWHTRLGNFIYFTADDGVHGRELWRTDGSAAGTAMVLDINPTGTGIPLVNTWLTVANGILYFAGTDGVNGVELWRSDGTAAGTRQVADIRTTGDASPQDLFPYAGKLLFSAIDGVRGRELWICDGTSVSLVKDINTIVSGTTTLSSTPNTFAEFGGIAYFRAIDTTANGVELWRTDGTTAGTYLLKDINPSGSSQPLGYTPFNGHLYFSATTGSTDTELWRTDGTGSGTTLVKDIYPGTLPSSPGNFTPFAGELWFAAESSAGRELWATDGTSANTRLIKDMRAGGSSSPDWFTLFNNALYFSADDGTAGRELWRSHTAAGTVRVGDFNPGTPAFSPYLLRPLNNQLLFFGTTATNGTELWSVTPPKLIESGFDVDTRTVWARFDQDVVVSNDLSTYTVTPQNAGGPALIRSATYNSGTRTARFDFDRPLADGDYRFTFAPPSITDLPGTRLFGLNTIDFHILAGDINRDRTVNFDDLLILAQNYGQTGKTFSQGNIDYSTDGLVGFDDLLLLAQRFGTSLSQARSITLGRANRNLDDLFA